MTVFERAPALYPAAGALCGALAVTGPTIASTLTALAAAAAVLLYRRGVRGGALVFAAAFAVTAFAGWLQQPARLTVPEQGCYTGLVERQYQGPASRRCIVTVDDGEHRRIAMTITDITPAISAGDSIRFSAILQPYLTDGDIAGAVTATNYILSERLAGYATVHADNVAVTGHSGALRFRLDALRQHLSDLIHDSGLSTGAADLLASATLGTSEIAPDIATCFRATGLAHLLCVSGFHLGVLAGVIGVLLLPLHYAHRRLRLAIIASAAWCYAAMTGMTPPVTRAAVMLTAYSLTCALERRGSPLNGLALAFTALVMPNPSSLYGAGFQLSFCAVAAIILYTDAFNAISPRYHHARHYLEPIFVPAAAAVGTLPVMVAWWGTAAFAALPFNAIGTTVFPLYMIGGTVAVVLWHAGILGTVACSAVNASYRVLSDMLEAGARYAGSLNLHTGSSPATVWALAAVAIGLAVAIYATSRRTRICALALVTAAAAAAMATTLLTSAERGCHVSISQALYGAEISVTTPDTTRILAPADIVQAGPYRIVNLRHVSAPDTIPQADIVILTEIFRGNLPEVLERTHARVLVTTAKVRRLPILPDSVEVHPLPYGPYTVRYWQGDSLCSLHR